MKYIIPSLLLLFVMTSCTVGEIFKSEPLAPQKTTLTHKAYYYYGMDEARHRDLIKEIMGVDPVTTEWCAAFVNMVLLENRLPTSESVSEHYLLARSFLEYGYEVTEPQQGDIMIFERGNEGWQGHVGFYVSTTELDNGNKVYNILGGNQNDSVNVKAYPDSRLIGIRRAVKEVAILGEE
jgi:uncharacterized protein (TIGR02594 family)